MLYQLIHTRCLPHRDLKNQGKVVPADGFGMFSCTEALLHDPVLRHADLLSGRMALHNGASGSRAPGLFPSYEYNQLSADCWALSFDVPRSPADGARTDGFASRGGSHIKQMLIGQLNGRPSDWFGADCWTAHQKPESDYYLSPDAEPALLPAVADTPRGGTVALEEIRGFLEPRRARLMQAALWFLLEQFELPEGERRVLLIRDTPEHVALWVAALGRCVSAPMARRITFATNRTNLAGVPERELFYYTDEAGHFFPMRSVPGKLTRHPYCMIVGYHPEDPLCRALRCQPGSSFELLDGEKLTTTLRPEEERLKLPYFSAAVKMDQDLQDFCEVLLPNLPIPGLTGFLPELFDAFRYLLDDAHPAAVWEYGSACTALRRMTRFGVPDRDVLTGFLLDQFLSVYARFAPQDLEEGFPLLLLLDRLAAPLGRQQQITGCLADQVLDCLERLPAGDRALIRLWQAVGQSGLLPRLRPALPDLLCSSELDRRSGHFKCMDPRAVSALTEMFFQMLDAEHLPLDGILRSPEQSRLVSRACVALLTAPQLLEQLLRRLLPCPALFHPLTVAVAAHLEKSAPERAETWMRAVIGVQGGDPLGLCRKLIGSKTGSTQLVERLLSGIVRQSGALSNEVLTLFLDALDTLPSGPDAGLLLFRAWIEAAPAGDAGRIIHSARSCELGPQVQQTLFRLLDAALSPDRSADCSPAICSELQKWSRALGIPSRTAALYEFRRCLAAERSPGAALTLTLKFGRLGITAEEDFLESGYLCDIAQAAAELHSESLHLAMVLLFRFPDLPGRCSYADRYVQLVLGSTRSRDLVSQLLSLCAAAESRVLLPGHTPEQMKAARALILDALKKHLPAYYQKGLEGRVLHASGSPDGAQELLLRLIRSTGCTAEAGESAGLWGFFRGKH